MKTKLYKELTPAEIQKTVCDLFGSHTNVTEYRVISGGNFNTTYYVKTDQEKNGLVLRAAPPDKSFLFDFHKDMMSAEPMFYKYLEEKGIPTIRLLKYAPEKTVIEREYMISEFLPSIAMNDPSIQKSELDPVYKEAGSYIRKLHTITNDKFGWKRPGSDRGTFDTWPQFVLAYMEEVANKTEAYCLFETEHIQFLRELFSHKINLFDDVKTPNMIHKDLHEGNILLHRRNGPYTVAAIIDLDWAIFGDRKWEFLSRCMINEPFLDGYGENVPQDAAFNEMSLLYKLLHGFFSAYVVKVEYGFDEWYEGEKNGVLKLINEIKATIA
jgi:aminoglycoside phosphotransferase (APT) family kinase protein